MRRLLRRGFVPLLLLGTSVWVLYGIGLFDQTIGAYATRGTVETGRLAVWPLAIQRYFGSPLVGVGGANLETYAPSMGQYFTPHNTFLAIALGSGVIPLAVFSAYCFRAARGAVRGRTSWLPSTPFRIPLLIYLLLLMMEGTGAYMTPWGIFTLSMAFAGADSRGRRLRLRVSAVRRHVRTSAGAAVVSH
jgi:hypothetical protein